MPIQRLNNIIHSKRRQKKMKKGTKNKWNRKQIAIK